MIRTSFTELTGCTHPIQQAVMGGISGRQLAAASASAGALGMLHRWGPLELSDRIDWLEDNTTGTWGVGFRADRIEESIDDFEMAIDRSPVIELCWAEPNSELIQRVHEGGTLAFWRVGSVAEGLAAFHAGVDVIVAQGVEAGGHLCGSTPGSALLEGLVDRVDVPVVAAGGIGDGRSMVAALAAGASAVRIGTLLVASAESDASEEYRSALVAADAEDSVITTAFGAEWPDAPHRVLQACIEAARALQEDPIGHYDDDTESFEIPRFSTLAPTRYSTGPHAAMAMYAGQGVGSVREVLPAATLIERLATEAEGITSDQAP